MNPWVYPKAQLFPADATTSHYGDSIVTNHTIANWEPRTGIREAHGVGAACLCLHRDLLKTIPPPVQVRAGRRRPVFLPQSPPVRLPRHGRYQRSPRPYRANTSPPMWTGWGSETRLCSAALSPPMNCLKGSHHDSGLIPFRTHHRIGQTVSSVLEILNGYALAGFRFRR